MKTQLPSSQSLNSFLILELEKALLHLCHFLTWVSNSHSNGVLRNSMDTCFSECDSMDYLTSFPAALQMALCSFLFAVSSRYSSTASMILSAYVDGDKGEKSSPHAPQPGTLQLESLTRKVPTSLNQFNKRVPRECRTACDDVSRVLLFNLQGGDRVSWV